MISETCTYVQIGSIRHLYFISIMHLCSIIRASVYLYIIPEYIGAGDCKKKPAVYIVNHYSGRSCFAAQPDGQRQKVSWIVTQREGYSTYPEYRQSSVIYFLMYTSPFYKQAQVLYSFHAMQCAGCCFCFYLWYSK